MILCFVEFKIPFEDAKQNIPQNKIQYVYVLGKRRRRSN